MRYPALTAEFIAETFVVDPDAGIVVWRKGNKYHNEKNGQVAGGERVGHTGKRYWIVKIGGKAYKRAYIIFASKHGRWPTLVDHIDGDSLNDRWGNLREVTPARNSWNQRTRRKSSGLPMGIRRMGKKFEARIRKNGVTRNLGVFDDLGSAVATYQQARKELFGEYSGL